MTPRNIRIYFNERCALPGSVDFGSIESEIKVLSITCRVPCVSQYDPSQPKGCPSFWMACFGLLRVVDGRATITEE
jgi:hypothetical protein